MEPDKIKYEDTNPVPQVHNFDIWNKMPLKQFGLVKCSATIPTATPKTLYDQIQIVYIAGPSNHIYLYLYDTSSYGWQRILIY